MFGVDNQRFMNWVDTDAPANYIPMTYPLDEWTHIAWVSNLSTGETTIYKNGVLVGLSDANVIALNNGEVSRIGRYAGGGRQFVGYIDHVRVYSKAFNSAEIKKLYAEGLDTHNNLALR